MATEIQRKRFSVAEFNRMGEAGIFAPDARLELLDGEILVMSPIGARHMTAVNRLTRLLVLQAGTAAIVSVQNPVILDDESEPQPDLSLIRASSGDGEPAVPTTDDVLLVVEVADSTLAFDTSRKVPAYARAGVPVTWLVDLTRNIIQVFEEPGPNGYRRVRLAQKGDTLTLAALPAMRIAVSDVL